MEGVNHEAVGLAGHLKLGRLIVLWDDNSITIDGSTELSRNEDVVARHQAAQWHTCECDGLDADDVEPRDRGSARRSAAEPDPLQDDHRLRRPAQAGHGRDPRLGARQGRGRGGAQGARAGRRGVHRSRRRADRLARRRASAASIEHALWKERLEASERKDEFLARLNGKVSDAWLQALSRQAARRPEAGRDAQGVGNGARGDQRGDPGDDRRVGRPHRLEQYQDQGTSSR